MKLIFTHTILVLAAMLFMSCGAKKQAVIDSAANTTVATTSNVKVNKDFATLEAVNADWQDVKIPIKVKLKSPKDLSISGTMTMTRNNAVNISLRMLGFEVGAVTLTQDSIIAYEKLNKRYICESLTRLLAGFPATVGNLQALLLGKLFVPGNDNSALTGNNATIDVNDEGAQLFILTPNITLPNIDCRFEVNATPQPELLTFEGMVNGKPFSCTYSDFYTGSKGGRCAGTLNLSATASETAVNATIELNFKKAKWNTGENVSTKIPKGYQRISGATLIKMLKTL